MVKYLKCSLSLSLFLPSYLQKISITFNRKPRNARRLDNAPILKTTILQKPITLHTLLRIIFSLLFSFYKST